MDVRSLTPARPPGQNLWIMNSDGTGAHQLVVNDARQIRARFTHDDRAVVYSQDRNGDEYYDVYEVPVDGGEPRNLTNTPDISETVSQFSPDGKLRLIGLNRKAELVPLPGCRNICRALGEAVRKPTGTSVLVGPRTA